MLSTSLHSSLLPCEKDIVIFLQKEKAKLRSRNLSEITQEAVDTAETGTETFF